MQLWTAVQKGGQWGSGGRVVQLGVGGRHCDTGSSGGGGDRPPASRASSMAAVERYGDTRRLRRKMSYLMELGGLLFDLQGGPSRATRCGRAISDVRGGHKGADDERFFVARHGVSMLQRVDLGE